MYIIWYVWPYARPCCCVIIYVYVPTGTFRSHCSSRLSKIILSNKYVAISDNIQIFNTTIGFVPSGRHTIQIVDDIVCALSRRNSDSPPSSHYS